jgi:hypothetical protein
MDTNINTILGESTYFTIALSIGMNWEKEISLVLQSRKDDTDMINVLDVLPYGPDEFQRAFEVALEMENQNLVKLLYSNFNAQKIIVEFTLLGKK